MRSTSRRRQRRTLVAVLAVMSLIFGACGGATQEPIASAAGAPAQTIAPGSNNATTAAAALAKAKTVADVLAAVDGLSVADREKVLYDKARTRRSDSDRWPERSNGCRR